MDPAYQAFLAILPPPWATYAATALVSYFAICTVASAIDAAFPPPPAGSWLVGPRNIIHVLALNKGNATNAVPAGAIPASVARKVAETEDAAAKLATAAGELAQRVEGQPEAVKPGIPVMVVGDDAKAVRSLAPIAAILATGLALSACTVAQIKTPLDDVRLFCIVNDTYKALATATDTPVLAKGQSAAYVNGMCDLIGGKPVALPVGAGQVATVVVTPVRESGL